MQRAFRQWKLFTEHDRVEEMKSGLEGQKAFLAGEVSKLKASIMEERKKRAQVLIDRWRQHVRILVFTWHEFMACCVIPRPRSPRSRPGPATRASARSTAPK